MLYSDSHFSFLISKPTRSDVNLSLDQVVAFFSVLQRKKYEILQLVNNKYSVIQTTLLHIYNKQIMIK